ncbi:gas vesicle protein K [Streptomyces sp. 71268]|uniref:gas vesicle protein K n=1 Tax=Streptomyces sp. 71268 TaxID=3002640 RepID=UPI0023F8FC3D|nr:gas vesicle protein GvpK [Streptomyces sp. 71268]WEV23945.1 gas vesicle protein K [Streptomyces sp. 71268]
MPQPRPTTQHPPERPGHTTAEPDPATTPDPAATPFASPVAPATPGSTAGARRLATDPQTVERDLIRLVLTIVELVRQLMERTALHRADQGDLSPEQEEQVGRTLLALEERMAELCERYGLTMADLNLDLGPLGSLLPQS